MIRNYQSMSDFLLHQTLDTLRGQRKRGIGIIRSKTGSPSLFLDVGRRPDRDGSLILPWDGAALATAACTAAALLIVIVTISNALYRVFGRHR